MNQQIKSFIEDWKQIRGKTYEFLEKLPESKMEWKPHELLGTFGMQLRHIGKSQEAYIKGLKKGKIDFEDKYFNPEIETNKELAIQNLKDLDKELFNFLETVEDINKEILFIDGVHGELKPSLIEVLQWLKEHEFYHQGIFTCYGRLAGLGKFTFM